MLSHLGLAGFEFECECEWSVSVCGVRLEGNTQPFTNKVKFEFECGCNEVRVITQPFTNQNQILSVEFEV